MSLTVNPFLECVVSVRLVVEKAQLRLNEE